MPNERVSNPLHDRLYEQQLDACESLDRIEESAWTLCADIRDLRIELSRLESIRAKLAAG